MTFSFFLEILGFIIGLFYLWWEYHANSKVWLVSMIMPLISMWLYFSKGIYADFAINIYYFAIAVYGYWAWTRHKKTGGRNADSKPVKELTISHTPLWAWIVVISAVSVLWFLLYWILSSFTDSTVPVADAFTTALSIVAMWMMARKFAEQWLAWFVVDAVCVGLYIYKGLVFYPVLYGIYTVIALFGYRKWIKMIPK